MEFRISFGNGQVHGSYNTRKEAERDAAFYQSDKGGGRPVRVQFRDPETGEWFYCREINRG